MKTLHARPIAGGKYAIELAHTSSASAARSRTRVAALLDGPSSYYDSKRAAAKALAAAMRAWVAHDGAVKVVSHSSSGAIQHEVDYKLAADGSIIPTVIKSSGKKASTKKASAKKSSGKKSSAKKAASKKSRAGKKTSAKKTSAKKTSAKKTSAKKTSAKGPAKYRAFIKAQMAAGKTFDQARTAWTSMTKGRAAAATAATTAAGKKTGGRKAKSSKAKSSSAKKPAAPKPAGKKAGGKKGSAKPKGSAKKPAARKKSSGKTHAFPSPTAVAAAASKRKKTPSKHVAKRRTKRAKR